VVIFEKKGMAMPAVARREIEIMGELAVRIIYMGKDSGISANGSMPWLEIQGQPA
jgi:hypothetical protein